MQRRSSILLAVVAIAVMGCKPEPRQFLIGTDVCEHCRMIISDARFAGQIVTRTGKAHVFDAVECLAAHVVDGVVQNEDVHSIWVTDFAQPSGLVRATEAQYVRGESVRSPMGMNIAAFELSESAEEFIAESGGEILSWEDVLHLVESSP